MNYRLKKIAFFNSSVFQGFTLIELLVVVAIIALLASIILASLNTARIKARDSIRRETLRSLSTALELYATNNNGKYPVSGWTCSDPSGCTGSVPYWSGILGSLVPNDISVLPTDYYNSGQCSWDVNSTRAYYYISDGNNYKIWVCSELGDPSTDSMYDQPRSSGNVSYDFEICTGPINGNACSAI